MKRLIVVLMVFLSVAFVATAQEASFEVLEGLSSVYFTDMTEDGLTFVGTDSWTSTNVMWTEAGGLVDLGGFTYGGNSSISNDGSVIAANANDDDGFKNAALWLGGTDWLTLGSFGGSQPCDSTISSCYGVSGDGSILVGLGYDTCSVAHGFRYEESTGMVDLGSTVPDRASRANGISDDGLIIFGWQDEPTGYRQGAYWDADLVQYKFFDAVTGNSVGEAHDCNSDGSIIVGGAGAGALGDEAWVWTEETGVQAIGILPGGWFPMATAYAVSEDGSIVGGNSGDFWDGFIAFIWTEETGMVALSQYLTDLGVTGHEDLFLEGINMISADGTMLVGWATDIMWNRYTFVVHLGGSSFDVDIECKTPSLDLPDQGGFRVEASNNSDSMIELAAHVDVTLCSGTTITDIRAGSRMLDPGQTFIWNWHQYIPARPATCDCDLVWTLTAQDTATLVEATDSCTISTTCN